MSYTLSSQQCMSPAEMAIPGLPYASYKIFAVASARYYHAPLGSDPPHWEYSNRGILVFGKNLNADNKTCTFGTASLFDDAYWFRLLVAKSGELKTVWLFNIPANLKYQIDKPFFHVLQGLTRRYGFLFDHDDAAATFADQVRAYHVPPTSDKQFFTRSMSRRSTRFRSKSHPAGLSMSKNHSPTTIAAPVTESFRHITHIGFNRLGLFEARNADPVWKAMLALHDSSWSAHSETPETFTANLGQPLDTVTMGCASAGL